MRLSSSGSSGRPSSWDVMGPPCERPPQANGESYSPAQRLTDMALTPYSRAVARKALAPTIRHHRAGPESGGHTRPAATRTETRVEPHPDRQRIRARPATQPLHRRPQTNTPLEIRVHRTPPLTIAIQDQTPHHPSPQHSVRTPSLCCYFPYSFWLFLATVRHPVAGQLRKRQRLTS
jgi:hypothetical protein